jgi:hypothetical protein
MVPPLHPLYQSMPFAKTIKKRVTPRLLAASASFCKTLGKDGGTIQLK